MTGSEIRRRFLLHFERRDHLVIPSASLIPVDDPTTLFNSAGMQPLQPFFQGLREPPAPRLASAQKCFRTADLEEVGRTDRHHTFFEMLGNFAPTGAYFKETAIPLAWELITDAEQGFGLPRTRLRVTTHPSDEQARELWRSETDLHPAWIYSNEDNWWGLELGPCGPDSEIWWDRGEGVGCGRPDCYPDHCERFLEFWNLVFPQFDRQPDGSLPALAAPAIDTGMGLERIASIVQGVGSVFETDLLAPIVEFVRQSAQNPGPGSERLIADHLRGMTFAIGDGVLPGNEGRGYVLRRLIRRAALHARRIGMAGPLGEGIRLVVGMYRDQYPYLAAREEPIRAAVAAESERFNRTLAQGMELFEAVAARHGAEIPGVEAFRLHDTFGFPLEMTRELAAEHGLAVDEAGFAAAMAGQRERSRSGGAQHWTDAGALPRSEFVGYSELELESVVVGLRRGGAAVEAASEGDEVEVYLERTPFYAESGGQVGDTGRLTGPAGEVTVEDTRRPFEGVVAHIGRVRVGGLRAGDRVHALSDAGRRRQVMRHHTATHLLNRALEEVLGTRNLQRGSWVGPDHTTFDFPLDRALSGAELERLEARVNEQVRAALPLRVRVMPHAEAVTTGATHLFEERYGEQVRVVCFGDWSCEFCGGTHAATTADVGPVRIASESSIGSGLRRLDLVAGEAAERLIRLRGSQMAELARAFGVAPEQVAGRVDGLRRELREAERRIETLQAELRSAHIQGAGGEPRRREARVPLVLEQVAAAGAGELRPWADRYLEALGGSGVVAVSDGSAIVVKVSRDLACEVRAGDLVKLVGVGGGRPEMATGRLEAGADAAFAALEAHLK